jgi:HlyD family secretion protein
LTDAATATTIRLLVAHLRDTQTRIDQGRAAGLAVGQTAQVVLRSQPGQAHAASVARLELLADAVTEERIAQVAFTTAPQGVSVGELAEVTVQLPATASGLLVPNAAVQRQAGQAGVWRLAADGKPAWVPVKVGATGLDGLVRVDAEGLAEGDRVVQHSQKPVQAGMRLQVVDALVPAAAPGSAK